MKKPQDCLSESHAGLLLELARNAIVNSLLKKTLPRLPQNLPAKLIRRVAVFVTLTENERLRGCIGSTIPDTPLAEAVINIAQAAAFEDPRFSPLRLEEISNIKIEISVLSEMRKVPNAGEISPGVHGVMVKCGGKSGLFLPQVWDVIPDKERFLAELCAGKAGLSPTAWKEPGTELRVFTVESFHE